MKVLALADKELRQIARDPLSLLMLLGLPAFMLVLYGFALNFDVRHVRLAVFDTSDGNNPKLQGIYVYLMNVASDVGAGAQDDLKIGDIAGVGSFAFALHRRGNAAAS